MSNNQNHSTNEESEETVVNIPSVGFSIRRVRLGLVSTLLGFMIFMLGTRPSSFGLDRSPVIGFVQIAVFLIGLGLIGFGGCICIMALWKDRPLSIAADIGLRLVATGYVIAWFAGMADVFGFGSHLLPSVPYFGSWQATGVQIGELFIGIGFMLLIPYPEGGREKKEENREVSSD